MMSYKQKFQDRDAACNYSAIYEGEDDYAVILWGVEKKIIKQTLDQKLTISESRHLDFATGTGRVLSFFETLTLESCGVDVSRSMLRVAEQNTKSCELIHADITQPGGEVYATGPYELITVFRFILNAEPKLREDALIALARRLTEDGVIILNNHGSPHSIKLFGRLYHIVRHSLGFSGRVPTYLTDGEIERIADSAGLRIIEKIGYGLLGGRVGRIFGRRIANAFERRLAGKRLIQSFGTCRIYCLEKKNWKQGHEAD